ncbi:G-protein coupled receptor 54-like [Branchiostoma lanceolatum]|uniref:G-protein coupled receptor 54-like n=1 Tax=Branchiostoma lanceolatum TaxID=7740 RepID=UPI00345585EC
MSLNESLQFNFGNDFMANATLNESLQFDSLNVTSENATEAVMPDQAAVKIVVPAAFSIICLVGISGNALVIYLVWRHKEMRTVTNYYIVNLAVTDLAFLICCVPFSAAKLTTVSWNFGEFICKFVFYFMQVTAQATCMTLAVLSLDRFWAIVRPFKTPWFRTPLGVLLTTTIIWAGSFLLSLPVAFFMKVFEREWYGVKQVCLEDFPSEDEYRAYIIYTVLISYVIPLTTSVVCHCLILRYLATMAANTSVAQQHVMARKKKVTRMVATVVILFAVCWAPNHVLNLWFAFEREGLNEVPHVVMWLKITALCLSYANSSVNPFVYGIMGENFKKAFAKSFKSAESSRTGSAMSPKTPKFTKEEEIGMVKMGARRTTDKKKTPIDNSSELDQNGVMDGQESRM